MTIKRMNPRGGIVILALILAALACNLGGDPPQNNPTRPASTLTPYLPTPTFILNTATPFRSPTPTATPVTPTAIPCVPLQSWTIFYTVQAGDTLYEIALATGTTVEQLVIANCLPNANIIAAGQLLRVPRSPVFATPTIAPTLTPTLNPAAPRLTSNLDAKPYWVNPQSGQPTTYHPTVRVEIGEIYNALEVDFYVNTPQHGSAVPIGTDIDPFDGAFVDYSFPSYFANGNNTYTFVAYIMNDQVTIQSNVFTIVYNPYFVPPEGRFDVLDITPRRAFDGTNYTLGIGDSVLITWTNAPFNATRIDFYMQPSSGQQIPQLIGSDNNLGNGAWITWTVPANLYGYIFGRATLPDGTYIESQNMSVISEQ